MKELAKVTINENQEQVVSGRELYKRLGMDSNHTTWFKRMCDYGFDRNVDSIELWSDSQNGNAVEFLGSTQKMSAKRVRSQSHIKTRHDQRDIHDTKN